MTVDIMIESYSALLVQAVELLSRGEINDNVTFNQTINCKYSMDSLTS